MQQCQICSGVRDAAGHSRAWHARQRGQLLYFVWSLVNSCLFFAAPYQHLVLYAQMLYFHAQDADGHVYLLCCLCIWCFARHCRLICNCHAA